MFQTTFVEGDTGILFVGSGIVTADEIRSAKINLLVERDRTRRIEFAIVDFQVASSLVLDTVDLRRIVELDRQLASFLPNACVAIVAPKDHMFGLARLWEAMVEVIGWRTRVFRSAADACPWVRKAIAENG
jgi:hypothetical protein